MTAHSQPLQVIRTRDEHAAAKTRLEELILSNPPVGSDDSRELEVLSVLLESFERDEFPLEAADPIEAIKLRMEQLGLVNADLVGVLGSRSRVSEILSGKRGLSVRMMRDLHETLGVPASVLLRPASLAATESASEVEDWWHAFPFAELVRRGWLEATDRTNRAAAITQLLKPLGEEWSPAAVFRRTVSLRSAATTNQAAVLAWLARVAHLASGRRVARRYEETVSLNLAKDIASLSQLENGPRRAVDALAERGVRVVCLRQLSRMSVDGAAFLLPTGDPVIGLTLRHDRLDNFWFTLMHELAHVVLHLGDEQRAYVDDTESSPRAENLTEIESEADSFAREALVPSVFWNRSAAARLQTPATVSLLASQIGVHSAVVAGRARFECKNYRILGDMIGRGMVRTVLETGDTEAESGA